MKSINPAKRKTSYRIILLISFIVAGACSEKKDKPESQVYAFAGNDINILVGETANLNGSLSSDLEGNPIDFKWQVISKPASSNAALQDETTATPDFTPDIQGKYKIELVVSNTGEDRDTVTVAAFSVNMVEGSYENLVPGPNVGIRTFTVAGNYLFATCEFTEIGGVAANKIARYDGAVWSALGCGLEEGSIFDMLEYKGELYVTGSFDEIGCIPANNIARWDIESGSWHDVEGGLTGGNDPYGFTLGIYNNELYVGGQFEQAGDVTSKNLAKWNGTEWSDVGNVEGGSVRELAVYKDKLYAGGFFSSVNGVETKYIAAYDGNNWISPGSFSDLELKTSGVVRHMAVLEDVLYISGNFSSGNSEISELITWNGNSFNDFGRAFSYYQNLISELTVINNILYIGGNFRNVVGSQANNILQWNGESWGIMSEGTSGSVLTITQYNNKIYIGGDFNGAGGEDAENISIWTELP
jgi:hypothetical protein